MPAQRFFRQLRVGLQIKAVVVLTFVVIAVTLAGGWVYFAKARTVLRDTDMLHASRMAEALALAARPHLHAADDEGLRRLANDTIRNPSVRYVALLADRGRLAASASAEQIPGQWDGLVNQPVSIRYANQVTEDVLVIAQPIIAGDVGRGDAQLVGAVRLVLDTSATTTQLAAVQHNIGLLAAAIVIAAIPLGYLLVWRVLVQPVRRLAAATRRLATGDFTARTRLQRNDEIGELAFAFDVMADEVSASRQKLMAANASLEQRVAARTAELQVANHRLRDEMTEKEEFIRAVSHDLSAPLRNIAGMATMVMMKWRDDLPEDVIARLQRIQANVDAESSLINDLLELSRLTSRPQKRQATDIGALLEELRDTFEFELRSRRIELAIGEGMPVLCVERNRIRQLFQNLIDNAIKYMHRESGGRIGVDYARVEGFHRFSVSDNGPGIAPAEQRKIFCVFRRAEAAAASGVAGKGVGLAWVRTLVSNYDGRVWVDSPPGEGTTFHVELSTRCAEDSGNEAVDEPYGTGEPVAAADGAAG